MTTTVIETAKIKARINYHANRAVMLCPNGHVIAQVLFNAEFCGSIEEAEMGARTHGLNNVYDRLAQACALQDAVERQLRS